MAELPPWPWELCKVVIDDYGLGDANNVLRTPMQDGAVDQRQIGASPFRNRRFEVLVKDSQVPLFLTWVQENGTRWFQFVDIYDGATRVCRIVGGTVDLQRSRRQDETLEGEVVWRGNVELEGFASPSTPAPADDTMDSTQGPTQ